MIRGLLYCLEQGTVNWVNWFMCEDRPALPFELFSTKLRKTRNISSPGMKHWRSQTTYSKIHFSSPCSFYLASEQGSFIIIIIGIQPLGRSVQRPEFSQATGMALVRCILGKFLGVALSHRKSNPPSNALTVVMRKDTMY